MSNKDEVPVSPVRTGKPELRLFEAAVNDQPAELDGTPTSPDKAKQGGEQHPLDDKDKEQLAELIKERKSNPAVLVDLPQTPQAEELAVSGAIGGSK